MLFYKIIANDHIIEDVSRTLIKRMKCFQYIYISYNLLREGSEHESTSLSHVLDWRQYNAPYPFYLIPLNLVELV